MPTIPRLIAIIDYGMGNLRSVYNAFQAIGAEVAVIATPGALAEASAIVLPGVGAFGEGMRNLRERGFVEALERQVRVGGKPFLGLCLGLQLLATKGFEHDQYEGLGWIPGVVTQLPATPPLRLPHVGWNDVRVVKNDGLFSGLGALPTFYFVHSFVFVPEDASAVSGRCDYGIEFVASVERDNICATQFHPEKSHRAGLSVLRNWSNRAEARC